MKSEKGMALVPLLITIFVLIAIAGVTIFMIADGFLYNKDVKSTVQKDDNNTVNENTVTENNVVNNIQNNTVENTISNEQ